MPGKVSHDGHELRIGEAAEALGVSVGTLRRWEAGGRIRTRRSAGGQRVVALGEVQRLRRARGTRRRPTVAQSARNRFEGLVTRIERDKVAALIEVQAGPHRIVSLLTREAVDELGLEIGDEAVCVVKATSVIIEVPSARSGS